VALLLLKLPASREVFFWINKAVVALHEATLAGTGFVFGYLGGGPLPFEESHVGASFVFAFQALPLVLIVSALSALLYYWRVLPVVVRAFARVFERLMQVTGAGGVSVAANVFVGMIEAPLFIRPYLAVLGRGELFLVMTAGMATIAGTVLVLYATMLEGVIANPAGHLLTASLINAPAAIVIARLLVPGEAAAGEDFEIPPSEAQSSMDAIARGALDGIKLLINIIAMLVVLVALVHLVNQMLGLLPDVQDAPLKLERILGWIMAVFAWLIGIPWAESETVGALLGVKVVLNELIAYGQLAGLPADALGERSRVIVTYALCGFANFGSLGIMIGGMSAMAPERRGDIAALGLKSIVAGTLATMLTATVVGLVI
jgi:CNT family concentrative nucleoside transporter